MKLQFGEKNFLASVVCAVMALLLAATFAQAQTPIFYQWDWTENFNCSVSQSDTEDNWVANSFMAMGQGLITAIEIPIGDTLTNQSITGLIYQGASLTDPTAGGGLMLMGQQTITQSTTPATIVTITFDTPVQVTVGQAFYAAVLIPAVPPNVWPFFDATSSQSSGMSLGVTALGQSFFDVALTVGGTYELNQLPANSANITVFGGVHPVLGNAPGDVQDPGNLALWVIGQ
jgi:hypothetical protein